MGYLSLLALGLATLAPAETVDTKRLADGLVRSIRSHQNADGTYGDGLADTCRVLDALMRSPRRYNELDGPFVREAAWFVGDHEDADLDGWRVLALAGAVTPRLGEARAAALRRLRERGASRYEELLALRTFPDGSDRWPALPASASAARRCLAADDPATTAPPGMTDVDAWVRWARAARLRGLPIDGPVPAAPRPRPDATLDELLADLDLVILLHGLPRPATAKDSGDIPLPAYVSGERSLERALTSALTWLDGRQTDGTFGLDMPGWTGPEPGITALSLSAAIWASERLELDRPEWVDAGLDYLVSLQGPDGSIQAYGVAVYTTSVAIEALVDGGRPGDAAVVERALAFLVDAQADAGEGYFPSDDRHYGGIGYGGDERPDLSNTHMAIEAAHRAGLGDDHAFYAKALVFLERCQNLGEVSSHEWPRPGGGVVVSGNDGGATYMPGNSPAGETELNAGRFEARSYGSMTFALTKSYLLCGLPVTDHRVEAALGWLVDNFTLETNPGFADPGHAADGLYYYYMALGRTLARFPEERLVRSDGTRLAWRDDLAEHLLRNQRVDGSWINESSPRWYEGAPTLCTGYALLALKAAHS